MASAHHEAARGPPVGATVKLFISIAQIAFLLGNAFVAGLLFGAREPSFRTLAWLNVFSAAWNTLALILRLAF